MESVSRVQILVEIIYVHSLFSNLCNTSALKIYSLYEIKNHTDMIQENIEVFISFINIKYNPKFHTLTSFFPICMLNAFVNVFFLYGINQFILTWFFKI